MVMNAIATAIGLASSIAGLFGSGSNSAMMSLRDSKELQEHQYELNRKTRQTSYQDTRQDLVNAGYNPLLAVGQQSNGGTFGASLQQTDPRTENLKNILDTMQANSAVKLNSAQAYNQIQQGKLTTAQASNLISQSHLNSAQTALTNLQQTAQHINNLNLPNYLKSQIRLNNSQAQAAMINAQANQVSAQANRMNAQTNSAVGASTAWRNYNAALGYTTSTHIGPTGISVSHTGNGPGHPNPTKPKPYYTTEIINGHKVQVKNYR